MSTADPSQLTGLAGWVVDTIEALGPLGVGVLVALETVFPPVPSEVVLPVSGLLAGQGRMDLVAAVVAATVGSVVGALALYWVGRRVSTERLQRVLDRTPLLDPSDVDRSEAWFRRHGKAAVLTGRVVPMVRSLVSVPAGVERMSLPLFVVLTAVGSGVYNGALVGAGYALGSRWTDVGRYSDLLNAVLLGALGVVVAVFVVRRLRRRARSGTGARPVRETPGDGARRPGRDRATGGRPA